MNQLLTNDLLEGYRAACKQQGETIAELREQMRHMVRLDDPVVTELVAAVRDASFGYRPMHAQKALAAYEARVKEVEK